MGDLLAALRAVLSIEGYCVNEWSVRNAIAEALGVTDEH